MSKQAESYSRCRAPRCMTRECKLVQTTWERARRSSSNRVLCSLLVCGSRMALRKPTTTVGNHMRTMKLTRDRLRSSCWTWPAE